MFCTSLADGNAACTNLACVGGEGLWPRCSLSLCSACQSTFRISHRLALVRTGRILQGRRGRDGSCHVTESFPQAFSRPMKLLHPAPSWEGRCTPFRRGESNLPIFTLWWDSNPAWLTPRSVSAAPLLIPENVPECLSSAGSNIK